MMLEDEVEKFRLKEYQVSLTAQTIVEFSYLTKEMIEPLIENRIKLFFEQANCYTACYYYCRRLLALLDPQYLSHHKELKEFFKAGRELNDDWDRLSWENSAGIGNIEFEEDEVPF